MLVDGTFGNPNLTKIAFQRFASVEDKYHENLKSRLQSKNFTEVEIQKIIAKSKAKNKARLSA
jgi:hypothetical protein